MYSVKNKNYKGIIIMYRKAAREALEKIKVGVQEYNDLSESQKREIISLINRLIDLLR
jgi:hypothetical protein